MRIGLDATRSGGRNPTGVAAYESQLINALATGFPEDEFLLCYRSNRYLQSLRRRPPGTNCSRHLLENFAVWLYGGGVDVFHGLNQRLPRTSFKRMVTTFHDLFVFTGEFSSPDFRERFMTQARDAAERSDRLIAISHFTADQAAELLDCPRRQIAVVHHGVDPIPQLPKEEISAFRLSYKLEDPFLLHVGAIQTRKNIKRLVKAFETLEQHCLLVLAGSAGYGGEEILREIQESPAADRIRVFGYVDREFLEYLYRSALLFTFPSLGEGFGLPILEAMSAGLPVVTSNHSALPEVAGGAALLVDPEDTESIRAGIARLLEDTDLYHQLRLAGLKRATSFTWLKAAHQTMQVYRSLV